MKKAQFVVSALLLALLVVACAPKAAPAAQPQAPAAAPAPVPAAAAAAGPAKPAWQEEWEKTLAAAKLGGKVTVWTTGGFSIRNALAKGVKEAYGIATEVLSGRNEEFLARALVERRAGLYNYDIYVGGFTSMLLLKPAGMVRPLDPALILPDVTDPALIKKTWYKGELPWIDREHTALATTLTARTPIVINTNLVKPDEVKSWRDLLNPKWRGKIIINDPTVSGAGQMGLASIDGIMGWDFVKELAKMEPIIMRDQRLMLEWVAHSKASIAVVPQPDAVIDFLRLGAPIRGIVPAEGTWVSAGATALSWLTREPHPNAAKVFINWLLSKEGQEFFAPAIGYHSAREDVRTDYLRPEDVRQEGGKYFKQYTEEFALRTNELLLPPIKELIAPLIK